MPAYAHTSETEAGSADGTAAPYDEETRTALEALGPPIMLFGMFARRPTRALVIHGCA